MMIIVVTMGRGIDTLLFSIILGGRGEGGGGGGAMMTLS